MKKEIYVLLSNNIKRNVVIGKTHLVQLIGYKKENMFRGT